MFALFSSPLKLQTFLMMLASNCTQSGNIVAGCDCMVFPPLERSRLVRLQIRMEIQFLQSHFRVIICICTICKVGLVISLGRMTFGFGIWPVINAARSLCKQLCHASSYFPHNNNVLHAISYLSMDKK